MADTLPEPKSRKEEYLATAAGMTGITLPEPASREEIYLNAIAEGGGGGGGGSDINVVQTTGTSTTDVMSQKAVTDALAEAGGTTVVQTTGTSTTDVMSQKAVTDTIFQENDTGRIKIGTNSSARTSGVSIGEGAGQYSAGNTVYNVALGAYSGVSLQSGVAYAVALGSFATPTRKGEVNVGTGSTTNGYNSTNYRVIGGVHDGQTAHDAATYGQLDTRLGGMSIVSITQTAYDQLQTKDANTLYVITGA